jgi:hypothetical protein
MIRLTIFLFSGLIFGRLNFDAVDLNGDSDSNNSKWLSNIFFRLWFLPALLFFQLLNIPTLGIVRSALTRFNEMKTSRDITIQALFLAFELFAISVAGVYFGFPFEWMLASAFPYAILLLTLFSGPTALLQFAMPMSSFILSVVHQSQDVSSQLASLSYFNLFYVSGILLENAERILVKSTPSFPLEFLIYLILLAVTDPSSSDDFGYIFV